VVKDETNQQINESAIDSSISDIVLSVNKLKLALADDSLTVKQENNLIEKQETTKTTQEQIKCETLTDLKHQDDDDDQDNDDENDNNDENNNEDNSLNGATGDDDTKYKLENSFKLEAMKIIKSLQLENESSLSTLQSCLLKFTANEILSDKIKCENCTKKHQKLNNNNTTNIYTRAIKQYLICELPAVLTIHLKRFQQHGYRLEKSNKHIIFPLILDMSPYTSKMCINIRRDQRNHSDPVLYSLYGIVEHSGRLNSGHYTAYVKAQNRENNPKQTITTTTRSNLFLGNQRLCHLNMMLKKWNGQTLVDTNNNSLEKETNMHHNYHHNHHQINSSNNEATNITDELNVDGGGDRWFYISDSHVTEVNVAKVLKAQAYILFYERIE